MAIETIVTESSSIPTSETSSTHFYIGEDSYIGLEFQIGNENGGVGFTLKWNMEYCYITDPNNVQPIGTYTWFRETDSHPPEAGEVVHTKLQRDIIVPADETLRYYIVLPVFARGARVEYYASGVNNATLAVMVMHTGVG